MSNKARVLVAAACAVAAAAEASWAQLRVVSFNTTNSNSATAGPRTGMDLILQAIATSVSDDPTLGGNTGIAKPIDVLALQESDSWATTGVAYANLLNTLVPGANYQAAQLDGASTGSGTQVLVYNANTVALVPTGLKVVGTASTGGQPRETTRFQLRPVGYGPDADIYVYNSHMKSGDTSTDRSRRLPEAQAIRADADALPAGSNIIYLGDFNAYRASEAPYQAMIAAGNAQAIDPIGLAGTWNNNEAFKNIHTQSPYNAATALALGTGFNGTSGGMDDRFDFQLVTANLLDGQGVAYIPNSYQAFGNNGSMEWGSGNNSINQGNNTAQPQNVLNAMASILDHLPVVADYQLPARMSVAVNVPARVIVGTSASASVAVTNSAPVMFANGADVLEYTASASGAITGMAAGTRAALAGAAVHEMSLAAESVGLKTGQVDAASTSQQVGNGTFSQAVNYAVVDHSNASLAAGTDVDSAAIDFGYVPQGFAPRTVGFAISNLPAASGFTAELALVSIGQSGSGSFSTDAAAFTNLAAGASSAYTAAMSAGTAGPVSGTQTFNVADEAIPGAAPNAPLTLSMQGVVLTSAHFDATGYMRLYAGETYATGPFAIGAGVTLTKTGEGAIHVTGPQTNGAGAGLLVSEGTVAMDTDAGSAGVGRVLSVTTEGTGTVTFNSTQHLASLAVGTGTSVQVSPGGDRLLVATAMSVLGTGTLDLAENDAIVGVPAETVRGYLATGRIFSSTGAADPNDATTIGYAAGSAIGGIFGGEVVAPGETVLKYTWFGDANLDGVVSVDDYALIDRGLAQGLAGWVFGDFDYSGVVDAADYLLIDLGFGRENGVLSPALLADRSARFGEGYVSQLVAAVPEPGVAAYGIIVLAPWVTRRRRVQSKG